MLPNPYVLLAQLVGLLIAIFGAYQYGYSRAEDAISARVITAQNAAVDRANAQAEAATARAVAQARAEAQARLAATTIRLKGERDAAVKARPECGRDSDSQRLLVESIRLANDSAASPIPMPDAVHADP